jgi:hypothetical protein
MVVGLMHQPPLPPQEIYMVLIFVTDQVNPRAIAQLQGVR